MLAGRGDISSVGGNMKTGYALVVRSAAAIVIAGAISGLLYQNLSARRDEVRFCQIDELASPKVNDPEVLSTAKSLLQGLIDPVMLSGQATSVLWDRATVSPRAACEWKFAAYAKLTGDQGCEEPVYATLGYDPASKGWRLLATEFGLCLKRFLRPR
jgi:hypothetical protein